jgi:hypothetical protein
MNLAPAATLIRDLCVYEHRRITGEYVKMHLWIGFAEAPLVFRNDRRHFR